MSKAPRWHAFRAHGADTKLYHFGTRSIERASHIYDVDEHPIGRPGAPTLEEFIAAHPELQGKPLAQVQAESDAAKGLTREQIRSLGLHPELDDAVYIGVVHGELKLPE